MTGRDATRELIATVGERIDERALAAFGVPTPATPDEEPDGLLSVDSDDPYGPLRRLLVGTDLDAAGVEDYVKHCVGRTLEGIVAMPRTMLPTVLAGYVRQAFLVGYHVHAEQARRDG